jgi:starch phosphorylase
MIAYFSMEIGVDPQIPTYAGGLGVLAGDTVRAAADLGLPFVAVTILHRHGYFRQRLDAGGHQLEEPTPWDVDRVLEPLTPQITVSLDSRLVAVRAWLRRVVGVDGAAVPVIFLDTDFDANTPADRAISHALYGGDAAYRLRQEAVLGIGGVRMLRALGYSDVHRFHLNEGHSALLVAELVAERLRRVSRTTVTDEDVEAVRQQCVFTTHTPVSAAQDRFPNTLVEQVLGPITLSQLNHLCCHEGVLNLTYLALNFSRHVNGVAMRHGEVSRRMYAGYSIDAITNGVHAATWVSPPFALLFDRLIAGWRRDNFSLRYAISIPRPDIWRAHVAAKQRLIDLVNGAQSTRFEPDVLTIGCARRATAYKRADLIVSDLDRLRAVTTLAGGVQLVFAGKAHPDDEEGKRVIERVCRARDALRKQIAVAYLADYDMTQAAVLTAGADVWLNTPQPPLEASGTSGMKAAMNGVPSLSVLDGWWLEGHVEGITGWAIGPDGHSAEPSGADSATHAAALYDALERSVLPTFYERREAFIDMMRYTIALNGGFFTAQRMLQEYLAKAYDLQAGVARSNVPRLTPTPATAEVTGAGR